MPPAIGTSSSSVPVMVAEKVGAEMRRTLGLAVSSGMLGVTLLGISLTPVFFFVLPQSPSSSTSA